MARGGKRENAGRRKGSVSEPTRLRVEVAEKALRSGITPLDYMLSILRDESREEKDRFAAAKEAAPYLHPKLAAVEMSGNAEKPLTMQVVSGVPRHEEEKIATVNGNAHHH